MNAKESCTMSHETFEGEGLEILYKNVYKLVSLQQNPSGNIGFGITETAC